MKRATRRNLVRAFAYTVVLVALGAYASRLGGQYNFRWVEFFTDWFPLLLKALGLTLAVAAASIAIALPLGITIGLCRTSRDPGARLFAFLYVELVRGTPLLVQLMIWYFILGTPIQLGRFGAAVCALSCFAASYIAEIVRAGIQSIDPGQMEAARSLGLTHFQALRTIILPQAMRRVMPPLASEFIALVKDSSLASVIALSELTKVAGDVRANTFMVFESLLTAAGLYLIINVILSAGVRWLELKLGVSAKREEIR